MRLDKLSKPINEDKYYIFYYHRNPSFEQMDMHKLYQNHRPNHVLETEAETAQQALQRAAYKYAAEVLKDTRPKAIAKASRDFIFLIVDPQRRLF